MITSEDWSKVAFNSRDPVYLQVVQQFKEWIVTGRLEAGEVIPSRRELGALLKINPNTAQKAYKEMEDQQLIITEGNSPSQITRDARVLSAIRSELIAAAVDAFVISVQKIDVPVDELLDVVKRKYVEGRQDADKLEAGGDKHD